MDIEAYLNQLCSTLNVDPLRRDEIRLEVHTHLRQRADALIRQGIPADVAEERAAEEFGPSDEIALQFSHTPPIKRQWIASPHVEYVGALLIAYGLYQGLSFLEQSMLEAPRYPGTKLAYLFTANGFFGLLMIVVVPTVFLLLGTALIRHSAWARTPVIVFCLANPWLMIDLMKRSMLPHETYWSRDGSGASGVFLFLIGIYALWAYSRVQRRPLSRTN